MKVRITDELAQQIVDSAKAVIGWNINFIDRHGRIMASTDEKRIGTYHKVGAAAARLRQVQTVHENRPEDGVSKGVNYPIIMDRQVLGVIGITGEPEVVSQYGFLLTKICEVFLKEYGLNEEAFSEQEYRSRQVMALIYHDRDTMQQMADDFRKAMTTACGELRISLFTYIYPDSFVLIIPQDIYPLWDKRLTRWKGLFYPSVRVGIGTEEPFHRVYESYRFAKLALQAAADREVFSVHADDMKLAFLLQSLSATLRRRYRQDICQGLTDSEIHLLQVYYRQNLSIQQTTDILSIHKNTLQYRLKKIAETTGLDPRSFGDAVTLYIATLPWF